MKKGIELEYWLVDETGRLKNAEKLCQKFDFVSPELLKPLLEIKTEPFESIDKLRKDVAEKTRKIIEEAGEGRLAPLGTPLNHNSIEVVRDDRFEILEKFDPGDIQKEKKIARAGHHIHFTKKDVRDQLNLLTALEPASSLLNSSPYHKGENTASSSRKYVYMMQGEHKFPETVKLWPYTPSTESWKQKMEKNFHKIKEEAVKKGVKEEVFEEKYSIEDSLWNPVRLREKFPTVEYRAPDAGLPSQILDLTEDINRLMEQLDTKELEIGKNARITENKIILPPFEKIEKLSSKGALHSLESEELRQYLEKLEFNTSGHPPLSRQLDHGNKISIEEARKIRIKTAEKLEKDIQNL